MNYKNDYLNTCLSILGMNIEELSSLLDIPKEKIELAGELSQDLKFRKSRKASYEEEKYEEIISQLHSTLLSFTHSLYQMPLDVILQNLKHKYELSDKKYLTLIEMIKNEDSTIDYIRRNIVEEICDSFFKEENIGNRASNLKILNKRIAEEVFSQKVEARKRWEYNDYGDYEVPEIQVLKEIYSDGSGEWWEKLKNYSQDISAAWEIIEYLSKKGAQVRLSNKAMNNDYWWCYIDGEANQGSSAPEAICLAALNYCAKNKLT